MAGMIIPVRDEAHWHELRAKNIGASEISALFDCNPYISRYALWMVKAGRMADPFRPNNRTDAGKHFEEAAAAWIAEQEGWTIEPYGYVQHDTVHGMGCTPDFRIVSPDYDAGCLEVKWTDFLAHRSGWTEVGDIEGQLGRVVLDEPPMHILLQLQHQLACTGEARGAVGCVIGGNERRVYRYERRPKLIAEIERRVADFWSSIDAGIEPPIDGSEHTLAAVKATTSCAGGNSAIEIDEIEFHELCAQHKAAKAEIKELDKVRRECEARIIKMMAGAERAYGMGWSASMIEVKGTPERVITEDMVGQTLHGRKGSVWVKVKEMTNGRE